MDDAASSAGAERGACVAHSSGRIRLVDAGDTNANGVYVRCASTWRGCPEWSLRGTLWRIWWPGGIGNWGWTIGEATEPVRTPHYVCEIDDQLGVTLGRWSAGAGLDGRRRAWCETEGHCTELWRERWHVYLTGHLPPMFSGGTDPAPTIEPFADPTPLPGVPPAATCHDGVVDLRDYMPPRDLLLPAAAVLVVGALSGVYMLARLALDLAGIEWDAADDL